jgi:hypothetical protein
MYNVTNKNNQFLIQKNKIEFIFQTIYIVKQQTKPTNPEIKLTKKTCQKQNAHIVIILVTT